MRTTTPLRYMRFFKRRETLAQDPKSTETKMIWDAGKKVFGILGFFIPTAWVLVILCLPAKDVLFDLLFYRNERFRGYVEQYSRTSESSMWTFNQQIRQFHTFRDWNTEQLVRKENPLESMGHVT
uniref:Uncharacterized protein n=1 Tax=Meloidogyne javanica TaxID=6303 RepID=A0A915N025_MELJA